MVVVELSPSYLSDTDPCHVIRLLKMWDVSWKCLDEPGNMSKNLRFFCSNSPFIYTERVRTPFRTY